MESVLVLTPEELRQRIKEVRTSYQFTQPQFAERLGIHWMTLSTWESGRRPIPPMVELSIACLDRRLQEEGNIKYLPLGKAPPPSQRSPTQLRRAITPKIRFAVFSRDGFTCTYCGHLPPTVRLEIDHIVPLSQGGTNDPSNLVTSCVDCNRGKGSGLWVEIVDH